MLAADDSGQRVASLRGGTLTVHRGGRRVATADSPLRGARAQLGWVRELLLVLDEDDEHLHVLDGNLEVVSRIHVGARSRILATSGSLAVLVTEGQPLAVFSSAQRTLAVRRFGRIQGVTYGCGDADGVFYLGRGQRLERWDCSAYRLLSSFRLVLEFAPTAAGLASGGRSIWFAREGSPLEVFRVSDWIRRPHPGFVQAVRGCPGARFAATRREEAWCVADVDSGKELLRLEPPIADVCMLPSARTPALQPTLVIERDDGELSWLPPVVSVVGPVAAAAVVVEEETPAEGPVANAVEAPPAAERKRLSRWRSELFAPANANVNVNVNVNVNANANANANVNANANANANVAIAVTDPEHEPDISPLWRQRLVRWSARAGTRPPLAGALQTLCERLALSEGAARAVAYLYRRRLVGLSAPAAKQLAAAIGGQEGWQEALGQGELARLGVLRGASLRPRLSRAARRFLDGATGEFQTVEPGAANRRTILEAELIEEPFGERSAAEVAAAVACRASSPLAWFHDPPRDRHELIEHALSARLHGAVALFLFRERPPERLLGAPSHPMVMVVNR